MRVHTALAVPILVLTVAAAPAGDGCRPLDPAVPEEEQVVVCEQQGWLHAPDGDPTYKIANLAGAAAAVGQDAPAYPTWDAEPPAGSVTEGEGSGYLTHASGHDVGESATPTFAGMYTGNLSNLAVDLYFTGTDYLDDTGPAPAAAGGPPGFHEGSEYPAHLVLEIDGTRYETHADVYMFPPSTSGNVVANRVRFVFTGLFDGTDAPEAVHDVRLEILPEENDTIFFFDATEVPSHLTFNKDDLRNYKIIDVHDLDAHEH